MEAYTSLIASAAAQHGVPVHVLHRLILAESGGNPSAVSPKGAVGVAQFMPATARRYNIDPLKPEQAIPAAAQYLADNYKMFGSWDKAVAGYNWGEGNVQQHPNPAEWPEETRNHVNKVMATGAAPVAPVAPVVNPPQPEPRPGEAPAPVDWSKPLESTRTQVPVPDRNPALKQLAKDMGLPEFMQKLAANGKADNVWPGMAEAGMAGMENRGYKDMSGVAGAQLDNFIGLLTSGKLGGQQSRKRVI